jgi:hypothetical protein
MTSFTNQIKPDSTELERYFLSVYTGNLWDALEKIKDWHSPEHIEKEVQLKLLKLQQQALPVVPEYVAVQIERVKNSNGNFATLGLFDWNHEAKPDYTKWIHENVFDFMRACTIGYTVEKPQLFYLKNKITGRVLVYDDSPELSEVSELFATGGEFELENYTFTQEEIDSMQTGSYEQIEVAE